MSQYTIQIDQFIVNSLQPEIDALNLSLASMEEFGYNNHAIKTTRAKLNKLISLYDFLKEYAYGDEEVDLSILSTLISISGLGILSDESNQVKIQNLTDSLDVNVRDLHEVIRVYIDGSLVTTKTLAVTYTPATFAIFGSDNTDSISVTITRYGFAPETYTGTKSIVIPEVLLYGTDKIILDVTTYNNGVLNTDTTITYELLHGEDPNNIVYYVGSTTERFTISSTDLEESSTITIDPNSGTNTAGQRLDWDWVEDNFDLENMFIFHDNAWQNMTIPAGASHALIIVPSDDTVITEIDEIVLGSATQMEYEVNYYDMDMVDNDGKSYKCYYLRDLTNLTFIQERLIQFNIVSV